MIESYKSIFRSHFEEAISHIEKTKGEAFVNKAFEDSMKNATAIVKENELTSCMTASM